MRRALFLLFVLSTFLMMPLRVNGAVPAEITAPVLRVIDGDTIEVSINGIPEKVRYIDINTPEIHHPTKGREPFGEEAKAMNRVLVEGKTVTLVFDVQQRDRYGRLLAYVYADGLFVNAELVRRGAAEVATFPPNVRQRNEFIQLQRQAMAVNAGLWGDAEARAHYRPSGSGVYGNKRTRSYFHVDDPGRNTLWLDKWEIFDSADDATRAGYQPSLDYARYRREEYRRLVGATSSSGTSPAAVFSNGVGTSSAGSSGSGGFGTKGGSGAGTDVNVHGYTRPDGTHVAPYTRSAPSHGVGRR